jgi:hypothetical protein
MAGKLKVVWWGDYIHLHTFSFSSSSTLFFKYNMVIVHPFQVTFSKHEKHVENLVWGDYKDSYKFTNFVSTYTFFKVPIGRQYIYFKWCFKRNRNKPFLHHAAPDLFISVITNFIMDIHCTLRSNKHNSTINMNWYLWCYRFIRKVMKMWK